MAYNLNALKGLFSKLKPAAKTVANYGDDVASAVANYGDDAMRFANSVDEYLIPYHQYDSIVQRGANPSKLDKLLGTTKYSDVLNGNASHDGLFSLTPSNSDHFDDAAKALTTYGDDAARMAFANADDLAAATAQSDDIARLISDVDVPTNVPNRMWTNGASNAPEQPWYRSPNYVDRPTPKQVLQQADYDSPYGDTGLVEKYANSEFNDDALNIMANNHINRVYNTQTVPVGSFTKPENTDELISYLNNADAELDSLSQLDPDAYKSTMTNTPVFRNDIAPEEFGGYGGYDNRLVGSFQYPDGFINPNSAAMYYDSLERGYVPMEYVEESRRIHDTWARGDATRRARGVPGLYDELRSRLGPAAFTSPNKSEQFLQNLDKYRLRRRR